MYDFKYLHHLPHSARGALGQKAEGELLSVRDGLQHLVPLGVVQILLKNGRVGEFLLPQLQAKVRDVLVGRHSPAHVHGVMVPEMQTENRHGKKTENRLRGLAPCG